MFGEDPIIGGYFRIEAGRACACSIRREDSSAPRASCRARRYETLTAAPDTVADLWVDLIRMAAVVKRSGIVSNPTFALSNYIRDQVAVSLLRSDYVPIVSGLRGIASEFGQGESAKLYSP
jgi:hypothetical protein